MGDPANLQLNLVTVHKDVQPRTHEKENVMPVGENTLVVDPIPGGRMRRRRKDR